MKRAPLAGCIICQGIAWITARKRGKDTPYCNECYNNEFYPEGKGEDNETTL